MKTILRYDILYLRKTSKFIVFIVLGIFLAGLSALTAKYFNAIIEFSLGQEGVDIELPASTVLESYSQFFNNFTQIYLIVVLFIAVMFFIQDKTRGHYPLIFTKPLLRSHYILSKSLVMSLTIICSYIISAIFFSYYTFVLFGEFNTVRFVISSIVFIVFMLLITHIGLLFSVIFKNYLGAIIVPISIFIVFNILVLLDGGIFKYMPQHMMFYPLLYMLDEVSLQIVLITTGITLGIIALMLYFSIRLFQSKSLL